jgi:hypothetical protein
MDHLPTYANGRDTFKKKQLGFSPNLFSSHPKILITAKYRYQIKYR